MKKLFLGLLLAIPANGLGKSVIPCDNIQIGGKIEIFDGQEECTVADIKDDYVIANSAWEIPYISFRQYYLQKIGNGSFLSTYPYQSNRKFTTSAKLVGAATILAGMHYAAKYAFGADYQNDILKNLEQQKKDFTKEVITPVKNAINSVGESIGSMITSADGYLKGPREALGRGMSTVFQTVADLVNKTGWFSKTTEVAQAAVETVTQQP